MLQNVQVYNSWYGSTYLESIFYDGSFSSGFKLKDCKDKYGTKKGENHIQRNFDNKVNSKFFIKISRKSLAYNKLPEFKTFYYRNTNIFYLSGQYFCNILQFQNIFLFVDRVKVDKWKVVTRNDRRRSVSVLFTVKEGSLHRA